MVGVPSPPLPTLATSCIRPFGLSVRYLYAFIISRYNGWLRERTFLGAVCARHGTTRQGRTEISEWLRPDFTIHTPSDKCMSHESQWMRKTGSVFVVAIVVIRTHAILNSFPSNGNSLLICNYVGTQLCRRMENRFQFIVILYMICGLCFVHLLAHQMNCESQPKKNWFTITCFRKFGQTMELGFSSMTQKK